MTRFLFFLSLFFFSLPLVYTQNNTACIVAGGITWTGDFTTTFCGVNSTSLCALYQLVVNPGACVMNSQCATGNPCLVGTCQPSKTCNFTIIPNCCNPPSFPCTSPPSSCFASPGTCFVSGDGLTRTCRYTELDQDMDGIKCSADCNDTNASVGGPTGWCQDADGDFYGSYRYAIQDGTEGVIYNCTQPPGYSNLCTDCNDNNKSIYPGALTYSGCSAPVQTFPNVNTSYINNSPLTNYGLGVVFDPVIRVMALGIPGFLPNGTDPTILNIGAVEVFFRNGSALSSTWQQIQFINPQGTAAQNNRTTFGSRIGLSMGELLVVWAIGTTGTTGKTISTYQQTSALPTNNPQYAFDAEWSPVASVAASAIGFANVVAQNTIVTAGFDNNLAAPRYVWISVRNYAGSGTPLGPVTLGVYNNYTLIQRLTRPSLANVGPSGDTFGNAVALMNDFMVIGDPAAIVAPNNISCGSIYTYLRNSSGLWNYYSTITPPGIAAYLSGSSFGGALSITNNTILVNCLFCNNGSGGIYSFGYVYSNANGGNPQSATVTFLNMFTSPYAGTGDSFGSGLTADVVQGTGFAAVRGQDGVNLQSCGSIDPITPGRGGEQAQYPITYPSYTSLECNVNVSTGFGKSFAMFTETGTAAFTEVWTVAVSDNIQPGNTYLYVCTSLPIFC